MSNRFNYGEQFRRIASAVNNVIPQQVINNMNMTAFANVTKNIAIEYKKLAETCNLIVNAIGPDVLKGLQVGVEIYRAFEKNNYNQFLFKQKTKELWRKFELEVKARNKNYDELEFLQIFNRCAKETNYPLKKGCILYRARIINDDDFPPETKTVIDTAIEKFNDYDYQKQFEKDRDIWEYILNIPQDEWEQDYISNFGLQESQFWGFNTNDSDAPERNKAGRANPINTRYLYAAFDLDTAISEVQPTIEQTVSAVEIEILKELKLFNFDFFEAYDKSEFMEQPIDEVEKYLEMSMWNLKEFFDTISELFSQPFFGNKEKYFATQCLSKYIRKLGFDGIKYKSSLNKGGHNTVLFDTRTNPVTGLKNYRIMPSSLYKVESVKITSKKLLPRLPGNRITGKEED